MSWFNRNPMEKRAFVKPGTDEPAEKFVTDDKGNVIGKAGSESEARQMAAESAEEFKEAA